MLARRRSYFNVLIKEGSAKASIRSLLYMKQFLGKRLLLGKDSAS
jgi:hypothetical protein